MCGISGWFDMAGTRSPDRALVKAMSDAIAHRGPDGDGFLFEPGLALGHRRLAIIDLTTGGEPMFTEGDRIAIVFNGEIYNFRELRSDLERRGHAFRTKSDTEVILRAWVEWGEACVERLRGQFAFALWDRNERTLFLARDRLGEKPLYYAVLPDRGFVFGSELKALLVNPALPRNIDLRAVEDYFAFGYITDPRTIYRDVHKLGAGCALTLRRGQPLKLREYWQPKPATLSFADLDEGAEALRARLGEAVKSQLMADVPIGAFLSGGVDSSAVATLMAGHVRERLSCFTIGFDDSRFDERSYATAVAERYGMRHFMETVSANDIASVEALPGIFDEPFGDSSALPTYQLARLARRNVTVALSGDGGDELFAGYRRYLFHSREEALRGAMPQALRKSVFGALGRLYPQLDWAPRPLRARQTFRELSCSAAEGYFHNVCVVDDAMRAALYSPGLRRQLEGYNALEVIKTYMAKAPSDDPVTIAQYIDLKTWLVGDILTKVDRTAMACGLEVRVPMLDPGLVEWALGLPRHFKLDRGEGKRVLKRALEPLVPREILYRPKQGFSVPLASWFRGSFGASFAARLASPHQELDEYFDLAVARRLVESHQKGWADNSRTLWLLWMFQGFLAGTHGRRATSITPAYA
jgi:asparagine synthase (glutamine-hydrolysing)